MISELAGLVWITYKDMSGTAFKCGENFGFAELRKRCGWLPST
jgi:hypothetical protein